mmetsp:Transcript_38133/g.99823  ORF Transcript_38133/g.99823 Transcript_38133/m.99823 type:complete len:304 (+) Transcript_38133:1988-2899(+)
MRSAMLRPPAFLVCYRIPGWSWWPTQVAWSAPWACGALGEFCCASKLSERLGGARGFSSPSLVSKCCKVCVIAPVPRPRRSRCSCALCAMRTTRRWTRGAWRPLQPAPSNHPRLIRTHSASCTVLVTVDRQRVVLSRSREARQRSSRTYAKDLQSTTALRSVSAARWDGGTCRCPRCRRSIADGCCSVTRSPRGCRVSCTLSSSTRCGQMSLARELARTRRTLSRFSWTTSTTTVACRRARQRLAKLRPPRQRRVTSSWARKSLGSGGGNSGCGISATSRTTGWVRWWVCRRWTGTGKICPGT